MVNITKSDVSSYTVTGEFEKVVSVRPDKDTSKTSAKQVTLRFIFSNTPLSSVIQAALAPKAINWQVKARKEFNKIVPKSVITISFVGGSMPVDPITDIVNRAAAAGMSVDEYLKVELAKRTPPVLEPLK